MSKNILGNNNLNSSIKYNILFLIIDLVDHRPQYFKNNLKNETLFEEIT